MADMIFGAGQRVSSLGGASSPFASGVSGGAEGGPTFSDTLKQALGEVSAVQENASDVVQAYLRGEPVELHQVMAASEEAGIALEMLVELRSKLTEAYRTVINMQS
jgi:flagellar hook-basal body complex protein FliE